MSGNKRRLILILTTLVILALISTIWAYRVGRLHIYREFELKGTDFLLPGYELYVGIESRYSARDPSQPFLKLYLDKGQGFFKRTRVIRNPKDLYGRVRITSPEMALTYVRLFTSPIDFPQVLFPGDMWGEVVPQSALDGQYFFSDEDLARRYKRLPEIEESRGIQLRLKGVLSDEEFRRNEFPKAQVKQTKEGFIVNRALFKIPEEDSMTSTVYWVEEQVSPKGKIKRKIIKRLENKENLEFNIFKNLE
jgi:hypothetical protein